MERGVDKLTEHITFEPSLVLQCHCDTAVFSHVQHSVSIITVVQVQSQVKQTQSKDSCGSNALL